MKENDESSKYSAYKYTAYQMRVASKACEEGGHRTVAAMLRQAAEVMEREEREKKWEYGIKWLYHMELIADVSDSFETVRERVGSENNENGLTVCNLVRRTVGEWEEVDDVQQ